MGLMKKIAVIENSLELLKESLEAVKDEIRAQGAEREEIKDDDSWKELFWKYLRQTYLSVYEKVVKNFEDLSLEWFKRDFLRRREWAFNLPHQCWQRWENNQVVERFHAGPYDFDDVIKVDGQP